MGSVDVGRCSRNGLDSFEAEPFLHHLEGLLAGFASDEHQRNWIRHFDLINESLVIILNDFGVFERLKRSGR